MKLFTEQQYQKLIENGQPENQDKDHAPVVWLYIPDTACQWLISELDPEHPSIAFGLCDLGMGFPELGYVDLEEIKAIKNLPFPLMVDECFQGKYPMSIYAAASRICDRITDKEALLRKLYAVHLSKCNA